MQRLLATAWCVALGIALMVGSPLTLQGSGVRSPLTPCKGVELDPPSPHPSPPFPRGERVQGVGGFKHLPSER
jgi:hypothetical protein